MYKDLLFLTFLEVMDHTNFKPEEQLELIQTFDNRIMGYRDSLYLHDQKAVTFLLGDMSPISRADSYFTNMKFFWEKSEPKDLVYSVGLFELNSIRNTDPITLFKTANFSYGYQSTCFSFNAILGLFAVGLDTGYIHGYKIEENRIDKIKECFALKAHSKRVMSIVMDGLKSNIFSIGEDGYLQVIDPVRKQILGCYLISLLGE